MGAEPYLYFTEYRADIGEALRRLREQEFEAGRYNPASPFPFDRRNDSPGAQHGSIEEARTAAEADGTRSILDLDHISEEPEFFAASPLPDERLLELFGTTQPTRTTVEKDQDFFEEIDRGHGIYIIVYRDGKPDEICFAGYSFD